MKSEKTLTQMYLPFYAACVFSTLGFFFFMFGFAAPYWLESFDPVHSDFLHMGIWSWCFDKFIHPEDYHANVLTGCYWIFDRFFFKIGIWEWLDPWWLVSLQVLLTIAFIMNIAVMIILVLYFLLYGQPAAESTLACGAQFFIGILLTISVITFGVKSQDRKWQPRPDQIFLAWGYGFTMLAAICSFIAAGFLFCVSYTDRAAEEEVAFYEAMEQHSTLLGGPGRRSQLSYGGHNARASVISGRRSMGPRSGISGAAPPSNIGGVVVKVPSAKNRPEHVITLDPENRLMVDNRGPGGAGSVMSWRTDPRGLDNGPGALNQDKPWSYSRDGDEGMNYPDFETTQRQPTENPVYGTGSRMQPIGSSNDDEINSNDYAQAGPINSNQFDEPLPAYPGYIARNTTTDNGRQYGIQSAAPGSYQQSEGDSNVSASGGNWRGNSVNQYTNSRQNTMNQGRQYYGGYAR